MTAFASPASAPAAIAATAALAAPSSQSASTPLTRVALAYIESRFKLYLRFGEPARTLQLDRWRRSAVFLPGTMFCRIRWHANDYGTVRWQLMVMQAATPLDDVQRIPGVRPGARLLLHAEGENAVRAVLERIDSIDEADTAAFEERGKGDRHQFRFIVSPEDAEQLEDLRTYTRHLMQRMEADLGTRLDWVAVDHWNTDNPHTHVVLCGKDDTGKDLIISQEYITRGMRERAMELATEWLGPRTELEIQRTLAREVEQERWTSLDRTLQREAVDGLVKVERFNEPKLQRQRLLLVGRLQRLQRMGLATQTQPGTWAVHADAEKTLRAMGERGDIIRTMQRAMGGKQRDLAVFQPGEDGHSIIGRVAGKGLADELYDRGYLVVDGIDGKAHYVALPPRTELEQYPMSAVVEVKGSAEVRAADKTITALATNGLYRTDHHLAIAQGQAKDGRDPHEVVAAHVRRLEALRRAGIVERVAEGLWKVPGDLPERGRQYDAQRLGGVAVELKSHLPIERQARVIGATWLDQQLIGGGSGLGDLGFGGEAKQALQQRADFLAEQGLAERRGQRVILARNLLGALRNREVAQAAKDIAADTGLEHRPVAEGQRVAGIYRRSLMLASGRYAMLDDGMGFSLVPWKPVIEQRLGMLISAQIHGGTVSWQIRRQLGLSIT